MRRVLVYGCSLGLALTAPVTLAASIEAVVEWSQRVELSVPVSGVIAQVSVDAGDRASRGQILLALDDAPFKAAVKQAEALTTQRKLERIEALRDFTQAKGLYERTVLSTVEFENAKTKLAHAEAAQLAAGAALDDVRYRLHVSAIHAPYDGIVISRQAQPGQTVAAELKPQTLLVFAAAGEYIARAQLPAERIAGLSPGQPVGVTVAGEKFPAKVRNAGLEPVSRVAGSSAQYQLEVVFMTSQILRAGQHATIDIP